MESEKERREKGGAKGVRSFSLTELRSGQEPVRGRPWRGGGDAGKEGHGRSGEGELGGLLAVCGRGVERGDCRTIASPPGRRNSGVASSNGAADTEAFSGAWAEYWGSGCVITTHFSGSDLLRWTLRMTKSLPCRMMFVRLTSFFEC